VKGGFFFFSGGREGGEESVEGWVGELRSEGGGGSEWLAQRRPRCR
jgi:hypothetical protein